MGVKFNPIVNVWEKQLNILDKPLKDFFRAEAFWLKNGKNAVLKTVIPPE